jgi:hypothetical protein
MKQNDFHSSRKDKVDKKKQDLDFKKWLLCLSSIGNLILGGLLVIMGVL